jgi:lipoyl-dependent peroxiredoxin
MTQFHNVSASLAGSTTTATGQYLGSIARAHSKYWRGGLGGMMLLGEMKPYTRKATVLWQGTRQSGKGSVSTPSAALNQVPYAFGNLPTRRGTNPPELIAAAHASSFAMTLAHELGLAGHNPRQIDATATVTMENMAAGWTMTQIHLDIVATVPKVAQCDFVDAALRAKANCPISRSLNANISMRAELSRHNGAAPTLTFPRLALPATRKAQKKRPRRIGASN